MNGERTFVERVIKRAETYARDKSAKNPRVDRQRLTEKLLLRYVLQAADQLRQHRDMLASVVVDLEERLEALESRPAMRFAGVYDQSREFCRGDVVMHRSALYIANEAVRPAESPGQRKGQWIRLAQNEGSKRYE